MWTVLCWVYFFRETTRLGNNSAATEARAGSSSLEASMWAFRAWTPRPQNRCTTQKQRHCSEACVLESGKPLVREWTVSKVFLKLCTLLAIAVPSSYWKPFSILLVGLYFLLMIWASNDHAAVRLGPDRLMSRSVRKIQIETASQLVNVKAMRTPRLWTGHWWIPVVQPKLSNHKPIFLAMLFGIWSLEFRVIKIRCNHAWIHASGQVKQLANCLKFDSTAILWNTLCFDYLASNRRVICACTLRVTGHIMVTCEHAKCIYLAWGWKIWMRALRILLRICFEESLRAITVRLSTFDRWWDPKVGVFLQKKTHSLVMRTSIFLNESLPL